MPYFLLAQSEIQPPTERAKRFIMPHIEAHRPAICGVRPW